MSDEQRPVIHPSDVGMHIGDTFKWAKDMDRDELLRLVGVLCRENEWRRTAARDAFDLLERANKLMERQR